MKTATKLPIPCQTPNQHRPAQQRPTPQYQGLFLEPVYADGALYRRDEDDDEDFITT